MRMHRHLLVCVSVFLPWSALYAQAQDQQKFQLSGSVVNAATGEPVHGALVQFQGKVSQSVMAGQDGHFEINGIPAGAGLLFVQRPGFAPNDPRNVSVTSAASSLVVKLSPLAKISGRVLDRDGDPIDGINVQCLQQTIEAGRKQWQQGNRANTDETGRFLLDDLLPGRYILYTPQTSLYPATKPKSEASRYLYNETFYPDAQTRESAQTLELAPGADMKIDMTLHSIRGARIGFTTVPPYQFVSASLTNGDSQVGASFARPDPETGVLWISGVPPGSWKLTVRGPFQNGKNNYGNPTPYGELPLEVGSADLDGLKVLLNKLPDIPVQVTGIANSNVSILLVSATRTFASETDATGALKISSVQPETYRVLVQPDDFCLASVTSGSQNLLREELVVSPGSAVPPIQISKGDNCPQLTVTFNRKGPAVGIITSTSKGFQPRLFGVSEQGHTFIGLPPGEYNVYAFDDVNELEYANPDALRNFKSQTVSLEAGQKASAQLEVNDRRPQ